MNEDKNWLVYMIETQGGRLYTGITNDLERRTAQHASGRGAKYFRTDPPRQLVWTEANHNRSSASKREAEIKSLNRAQKLSLVKAAGLEPTPL